MKLEEDVLYSAQHNYAKATYVNRGEGGTNGPKPRTLTFDLLGIGCTSVMRIYLFCCRALIQRDKPLQRRVSLREGVMNNIAHLCNK